MPKPPRPGHVFKNLFDIAKILRGNRVIFTAKNPFSLTPFPFFLEVEWIKKAFNAARAQKRSISFSEFEDIHSTGDCFRLMNRIVIEVISEGEHAVLFVNTCPIAQLDVKGEVGIAEFFELPPMTEEEWTYWSMLGASTVHFEIEMKDQDLCLVQVKKEEGIVNALRIKRRVNLRTIESDLEVFTEKCTLLAEPTLANLLHWIDVRSGTADPVILKHF